MIRVAIAGASGYAGGELLRLLLSHPEVSVSQITSETYAGEYAHFTHPNLRNNCALKFSRMADLKPCNLLFLALPHGHAMRGINDFAGLAERLIDLSGDFRLASADAYARWYGVEHSAPDWLGRFVYGVPELNREQLSGARYATGTGCNAMVTMLGLWPLYRRGLVREAVVDVKVGSSEGGNTASSASHHPERANAVRTYAPTGHRHLAELIQVLDLPADQPGLHFSITSVEMVRGALATGHCLLHDDLEERDLWRFFREDYAAEPFVRLVRSQRGLHRYPEPKILTGSNYCDVGFARDPVARRVVVISAIDNLMKGAAGNAVQVMNLMFGLSETLALEFPGLHPI